MSEFGKAASLDAAFSRSETAVAKPGTTPRNDKKQIEFISISRQIPASLIRQISIITERGAI
jgi:hypothetical protein